jgi:processive 1,2-diacylglycerol beta-glucosyltransferase
LRYHSLMEEESSTTLDETSETEPAQEAPADTRPTVIVMHASVGSGHRSAALAIAEAFEILRDSDNPELAHGIEIPEDLEVDVVDILDLGRIVFDGDKTATMFTGATRPIYDLTWRYSLTGHLLWGGGTIWSRLMYPKFTEYVKKKKPIAVVCTHITAANVAVGARMLSGIDYPILSVPTDYEIEGLWPHRSSDLFCVANEAMAETLRPRKVSEKDILITGIPTRNDFRKHYDKEATREELGLPKDKMVVLTLAGAYLSQPYVLFRQILDEALPYLHLFREMHFVFIAGNDGVYAEHLRKECAERGIENITVFNYVDQVAALMAASDLVICKSGGLTVTECLCARVPMILLGKTYGQEKSNRRMLTAMGAALHVTTARELLATLSHITRHPHSVDAMAISGEMLRRPDAALDVARAAFIEAEKPSSEHLKQRKKHFIWFYWGRKPTHTR